MSSQHSLLKLWTEPRPWLRMLAIPWVAVFRSGDDALALTGAIAGMREGLEELFWSSCVSHLGFKGCRKDC
jgi:hypothetical protein